MRARLEGDFAKELCPNRLRHWARHVRRIDNRSAHLCAARLHIVTRYAHCMIALIVQLDALRFREARSWSGKALWIRLIAPPP